MAAATLASGITIEYEVHGEGEPLLLVMGLGGQLVSWPRNVVSGFVERGFKVIVFDNRDIGLSSKGTSRPPTQLRLALATISKRFIKAEYLLSDMARDAIGLLDALDIDQAHVAGMSMGGMIAQTMAIEHPSRVKTLTSIMSTTGHPHVGRPKFSMLLKARKLTGDDPKTYVERQVQLFSLFSGSLYDEAEIRQLAQLALDRDYTPAGVGRQTAAIYASPDRTPLLNNVDVPTLVIHGLEDSLVQPSGGIATVKAVPRSRLLMFPDMGHNVPQSRVPEVIDAVVQNAARQGFVPTVATL